MVELVLPPYVVNIAAGVFGALWGSFTNVVIHRVPRGEGVAAGRSHCPSCGAMIRWYDNVPVLSYLWLRGRCRGCRARISPRYALVELLGAGVAVELVPRVWGEPFGAAHFFLFLAFALAMVAIAFIDRATYLIPDVITWPGIAIGLAASWLPGGATPADAHLGALAGAGGMALLRVVFGAIFRREALGWGDAALMAFVGAFLGWQSLWPVLLFGSLVGSLLGGLELLVRGAPRPPAVEHEDGWTPPPSGVAFGTFLASAAVVWLLYGDELFGAFSSVVGRLAGVR